MEGNMFYHQYMKPNSEYYEKMSAIEKAYEVNEIPDTYAVK